MEGLFKHSHAKTIGGDSIGRGTGDGHFLLCFLFWTGVPRRLSRRPPRWQAELRVKVSEKHNMMRFECRKAGEPSQFEII